MNAEHDVEYNSECQNELEEILLRDRKCNVHSWKKKEKKQRLRETEKDHFNI